MSEQYPGGWITKSPPLPADNYETTPAPGIWNLTQQAALLKQNLWPTVGNVAAAAAWVAQVSGTQNAYAGYQYNTNNNTTVYGNQDNAVNKYIIAVDDAGAVVSQTTYSGGTSTYEEFSSWGQWYDDDYEIFYAQVNSSARMGACKIVGSNGFGTGSTHTRVTNSSSFFQYPNSSVYMSGVPGTTTETIVTTGFDASDNCGFGYWMPYYSNYYGYSISPSGSSRDYCYTGAPSIYTNKINFNSITNNPTQYSKEVYFVTFTSGSSVSGIVGVRNSTTNAYLRYTTGNKYNTRWIVGFQNNDTAADNIVSFDYNGYVKDQISLSSSSTRVPVLGAFQPSTTNGAANEDDVFVIIKDPSASYTYYFVIWRKDDNNNATSGGSGNSGGTWNYGSTAKKLVFDSAYSNDGTGGAFRCGYKADANGNRMIVFGMNIGFGGIDLVFQVPLDLSLLADGVYPGVVTISSGSSVNATVDSYKDQSRGSTFTGANPGYSVSGTSYTTVSPSASTASLSPAFVNKQEF